MKPTDTPGVRLDDLLEREWLITNRLGGFAASTLPSLNTRKYHGLLVAAMAPPVHRMVLLSRVEETVHCDGWPTPLACNEYPGAIHPLGHESLRAFSHEPFPRWAYQGMGWSLEKSLQLLDGENAVMLTYTLLGAPRPIELELRPLLALRPMHELMYQWNGKLASEEKSTGHHRVPPTARTPELFFAHDGKFDASVAAWYFNTIYRREQERGYAGLEDLWSPGLVKWTLSPGESVHFVCSADPIELQTAVVKAKAQAERAESPAAIVDSPLRDTDHDLLVRAAGVFTVDRADEAAARSIPMLTRLPWSPPNARDALIGLPGVLLATGKFDAARAVLLSLASRVRNGVLPSEFHEDASEPACAAADAGLWFVNAVWQYFRYTRDEQTVERLLDTVLQVIRAAQYGADPFLCADARGLLSSRMAGRGATWMEARIGDNPITPRAGRPVELNALWYNDVRIAAELCDRFGHRSPARDMTALAATIRESFNDVFWNADAGCCYDVVDDDPTDPATLRPDDAIRPNQLLALSLPFPVLAPQRHAAVLERVRGELMTPFGPRTLSPRDPNYRGRYGGDVAARERACHNGTVHPWLLGALVTAHVRTFGRSAAVRDDARTMLQPCLNRMRGDGLGHLCELFDGDPPHRPAGALATAASAGELLRCYVEDILDLNPPEPTHSAPEPQPAITLNHDALSKR